MQSSNKRKFISINKLTHLKKVMLLTTKIDCSSNNKYKSKNANLNAEFTLFLNF